MKGHLGTTHFLFKKVFPYLVICLFSFCFTTESYASHAVGADLSYTCLGGNQYEFQLAFYRDCDGIPAPTSPLITISSASCVQQTSLTMTLESVSEVSDLCNAQIPNSSCNGGTLPGVEEHLFTGVFTLPANCSDWVISYSLCCRNVLITNSQNPQTYALYVESTLNNIAAPCNSSPFFTTRPVPYLCSGQLINYNHGAIDPDGDSLVYTLVNPLDDPFTPVPHIVPFTAAYPISTTPANSFGFDILTGQMNFNPAGPQIAILAVLVEEYRNGIIIGSAMRDMQVIVLGTCANTAPDVTPPTPGGVSGGTINGNVFQVCAGQTLGFTILASDSDPGDTLTVTTNIPTAIPGATVTTTGVNPVIITFNWPTTSNDVGVHSFTVTISDDACPVPGDQVLGYDILVPGVEINANDTLICPGTTQLIQLNANPVGGSGNGTFVWTPPTGLSNPNIPNPVATVTSPITYTVTYDDGICTVMDVVNIQIDGALTVTPPTATICEGAGVTLNANYMSTVPPPVPMCDINIAGCSGPSTNYSVGNGTTATGPAGTSNEAGSPFMGYYQDGKWQAIYTAAELNALGFTGGLITDLAFNISTKNSTIPFSNFAISIGCTQDTFDLGSLSFLGGTTLVYSGTVSTTLGWNTFTFTNGYEWNGVDDLLVEVCFDNVTFTNHDHVFYTQTPNVSVIYNRQDFNTGCSLAALNTTDRKPNIRINTCAAPSTPGTITYNWTPTGGLSNPTIASPVASPTSTTTYTVVVDNGDCLFTDSVTVTVIPFNLTTMDANIGCTSTSGTISVTVTNGGVPPYSYIWTGGSTVANPTLPPGTYVVTVSDSGGCVTTASATVIGGSSYPVTLTPSNPACSGATTGTITATTTGGNPPYTYTWSDPTIGNTPNATGLTAGTYIVTLTDASSCTGTASVTLTTPNALTPTTTITNVLCFGESTGIAGVTLTGGTQPYTYVWSNSATTATINSVPAGTYTVTVSDAAGCSVTASAIVGQPATGMTASALGSNVLCNGSTDGSITLNVNLGVPPYTFVWTNGGGTNQNPTGLGAGTYNVVITDATGCTATASAIITEPVLLGATSTVQNIACNGNTNGGITVVPSGGIPPYTYNWNNGLPPTGTQVNLPANTYNLSITDNNGCIFTSTYVVTQPPVLFATALGETVACFGGTDGDITLTAGGGSPPLTYLWSNGAVTPNLTGLSNGTYSVVVTDANGCTATASAQIIAPGAPLIASATGSTLICNGTSNGTTSVTATGGTPPYTYQWNNGAGNSPNPTGLPANTYIVVITDANGCITTQTAVVSQPPPVVVSASGTSVSCQSSTDGTATVVVVGGVLPYTYVWSGGGGNGPTATGLSPNTYTVLVSDANGCTGTASVVISAPTAISATANGQTLACFGDVNGTIDLTVNGGTPPYVFNWSNNSNAEDPTGLSSGTYTVIITDANGCTFQTSASIIDPPPILASIVNPTDASCFNSNDGTATVNPAGGTPPYYFIWDNSQTSPTTSFLTPGIHSVTVTDSQGCSTVASVQINAPSALVISITGNDLTCNQSGDGDATVAVTSNSTPPYTYQWSNGGFSPSVNGLNAGLHTVTVTDANGCQQVTSIVIGEPSIVQVTVTPQSISCSGLADGGATVTANGGSGGYTYQWSNNTSGPTIGGLTTGTYSVTATDSNGCTGVATFFVDTAPPLDVDAISSTPVACFGGNDGTVTVVVTQGVPPYTYQWSGGQTTQTVIGLGAGSYTVVVTDANGCTSLPETVNVTQPNTPVSSVIGNINEPSCEGLFDGNATITVQGGVPGYTIVWSNGDTGNTVNNINAGTYQATITDANGCVILDQFTVGEPAPVSASATSTSTSCNGFENGSLTITNAQGGTAPYFYSINGVDYQPGATFIGLNAGDYGIYVEDVNGCPYADSITVAEPVVLDMYLPEDQTIQYGDSIQISPYISVPPGGLTITWTPTQGLSCESCPFPIAKPDFQTTYIMTISDPNGCEIKDDITIFVTKERNIFIPTGFSPNEDGNNDVFMVHGGDDIVRVRYMKVFDRWGEMIFEAKDFPVNDPTYGWDGRYRSQLMNSGVFAYVLEVEYLDGEVFRHQGDVTLLR